MVRSVACGVWCVVCGVWCVVVRVALCGVRCAWHVVGDAWCMAKCAWCEARCAWCVMCDVTCVAVVRGVWCVASSPPRDLSAPKAQRDLRRGEEIAEYWHEIITYSHTVAIRSIRLFPESSG